MQMIYLRHLLNGLGIPHLYYWMSKGQIDCAIDSLDEVKKEGAEYALRYEDYTAELKGKDLVVKQGETNQLHITPEAGSLVYDNYEVSLSKEDGFSYSDGYNKATVTNEGIAASSGEKELSFNKQKQLSRLEKKYDRIL